MRHRPAVLAVLAVLALPASAHAGHGLKLMDHAPPNFAPAVPIPGDINSGGEGAQWEHVNTIFTGNPHTDLDFFTRDGETYASVGTLGTGPNAGGQSIVKLTQDGEVTPGSVEYVTGHPSAACLSDPSAALGLQHDVEATPKGQTILNTANPRADRRDAQLLIDATDAEGRCHDQGTLGLSGAPRGGLELIDVTDVENPVEIGLTSHIGEAHTVNVDPKRPHIAYAVTSDSVSVTDGVRNNENPTSSQRFNLDGFEVVDLSSCMNFPEGASVAEKRDRCRPEVYRYRYPTLEMAQGHTNKGTVYGCHELEVYPDDRLTCASGQATMLFDMSKAFDDNGTPADPSDDKPKGTPLPCRVRDSSSAGEFSTGAKIVDCVDGEGEGTDDLSVAKWLESGAPSLTGVEHLGSAFHQGRNAANQVPTEFDATEDIDFDHEAELTGSGKFILATDERGGGVLPPGASCPTSPADNAEGNGGIHAYRVDALRKTTPGTADEAFSSYATTPEGDKAIYRAPIRTQPQATFCTAHVFQQIPGQNRIFMGWYSQGTQVVDFTENADGTITFKDAGHFIPPNANTWVSHVFKAQDNGDGTWTYWGATGDFNLGAAGRSAVDVYKVTLPAPPTPAGGSTTPPPTGEQPGTGGDAGGQGQGPGQAPATGQQAASGTPSGATACAASGGFRSVSARPRGARLSLGFDRRVTEPVQVDVFQQSVGRRVIGERLVARFTRRSGGFEWNGRANRRGRKVTDGYYFARFRVRQPNGRFDTRRVALRRVKGKFGPRASFYRRDSCDVLRSYKLTRPVFGGRTNREQGVSFQLNRAAQVRVTVLRGNRVVRRFAQRRYAALRTYRLRLDSEGRAVGDYRFRIEVREPGRRAVTSTLTARRL